MRVLILGGTSIAGQALLSHLRQHFEDCRIDVVSRQATSVRHADDVIRGKLTDILKTPLFAERLMTYDAVVHLADGVPVLQERRQRGNLALADQLVAGTRDLALAVKAARVPLFIYVSSLRAVAGEHDVRTLDERSEPRCTSLYGRTKLRVEGEVAVAFQDGDTRAVTLRVPALYGAGSGGNFRHLLRLAALPVPLPLAGVANRRSILSMRNFASAVAHVMTASGRREGLYLLHDGRPLSTAEIVSAFRDAFGRPPRLFAMPRFAMTLAMRAPVVHAIGQRVYGSNEVDDRHFRSTFGWTPCEETRDALDAMARAYAGRAAPAVAEPAGAAPARLS